MDQLWIIAALIFGAAVFAIQAANRLYFRSRETKKSINRRLTLSHELSSTGAVLEALRKERGLTDYRHPILTRLNDFKVQTGLDVSAGSIALSTGVVCVVLFVVLSVFFGLGLTPFVIALFASLALVYLFLRFHRNRRIARFGEQLPDAIDIIVRGVRVGHPFSTALNLVAKEMRDPIGTEFGMTSDEVAFGSDVRTAIENLYRRIGQEDLLFFIVAVNIQSQTGGNLAEVLSRLAYLVRQRLKLRLKVRAVSAEGRMSAIALSLMPFLLFFAINILSPRYFGDVRDHPLVLPVLLIGITMLVVGNFIMYRMVNFKV
jgi:tight adherence protein B